MKRSLTAGAMLVAVLLMSLNVFAAVTVDDIAAAIPKTLRHPYLFFSDSDKAAMHERIETVPAYRDIVNRQIAEADRLLYTPSEPLPGDRAAWSGYRSENLRRARTLAFVYQMTGDTRYAEKGFEFADKVCDMPEWHGGAFHSFPIIYDRIWPWNVDDDQVSFGYDIITGDTAREMAAVYDWLYPALEKRQRDRIRGALLEKAILRVRKNYDYHWWATAYRCNWCSVCYSGLACASAVLLTEEPGLTDVIAAAYNGVEGYLNSFGVDGGWPEGVSYWSYGFRQSVEAADAIKRITGGKHSLFKTRTMAEKTVYFPVFTMFPNNKSAYFCDSYSGRPGSTFIINKLATEARSGMAAWYRTNFFGTPGDIFDIIWPESGVAPVPPDHQSHHFSSIGWAIMRSDFTDTEKVTVACKAGMLNDPHHGHLDCGTFTIQWKDREFISEMGLNGYDRIYFHENRWDSPQASSVGHNVVFVNGELQIPGKHKDKPWQETVGGKILEYRPGESRDYVLMDATNAYPKRELKLWRRHIIHDKPLVTVVLDEVGAAPGAEIETRFHSKCATTMHDGFVLLEDNGGMMALIPAPETAFTFREGKHAFQRIREGTGQTQRDNTDFKFVPYFGTILSASSETTLIPTVIVPVESGKDAAALRKSMRFQKSGSGYNLTFTWRGKKMRYSFSSANDGLILE